MESEFYISVIIWPEADLGMFSMFDRTGATTQMGPHTGSPFLIISLTLTNSDPNLKPNKTLTVDPIP